MFFHFRFHDSLRWLQAWTQNKADAKITGSAELQLLQTRLNSLAEEMRLSIENSKRWAEQERERSNREMTENIREAINSMEKDSRELKVKNIKRWLIISLEFCSWKRRRTETIFVFFRPRMQKTRRQSETNHQTHFRKWKQKPFKTFTARRWNQKRQNRGSISLLYDILTPFEDRPRFCKPSIFRSWSTKAPWGKNRALPSRLRSTSSWNEEANCFVWF